MKYRKPTRLVISHPYAARGTGVAVRADAGFACEKNHAAGEGSLFHPAPLWQESTRIALVLRRIEFDATEALSARILSGLITLAARRPQV